MGTNRRRWFWPLVMALALASLASPLSAEENQFPEGKVAVVNGSAVTRADFDWEMNLFQLRFLGNGKSPTGSALAEIRQAVLERLINSELLYQESQKEGIRVADGAVSEQLIKLKKRFSGEDEFSRVLAKANLAVSDLKRQIRRGMATQQFINIHFAQKVAVSEEETKAYFDSNQEQFKQPSQVRASHILIKVDPQAEESRKAEARKKLEDVKRRLQNGEDFAALAKKFSQGPRSAKGGDLGYFTRGRTVKPFGEAAFALSPGEVSDIVETRFGYHLIKVIDKKPETALSYDDVKDRLQQYLKGLKLQKEVKVYLDQLKGKAKVERFLLPGSGKN